MCEPTISADEVSRTCWRAATAAAMGHNGDVDQAVIELLDMAPDGLALRLTATGWAALVAQHVLGDAPPSHFSAHVQDDDGTTCDATETFAAVVCAIGNGDGLGAAALLHDCEPDVAFGASMQLLAAAGAALANAWGITPRRP